MYVANTKENVATRAYKAYTTNIPIHSTIIRIAYNIRFYLCWFQMICIFTLHRFVWRFFLLVIGNNVFSSSSSSLRVRYFVVFISLFSFRVFHIFKYNEKHVLNVEYRYIESSFGMYYASTKHNMLLCVCVIKMMACAHSLIRSLSCTFHLTLSCCKQVWSHKVWLREIEEAEGENKPVRRIICYSIVCASLSLSRSLNLTFQ